ncbi:hypothetical protein AM588_10004442 [Phytophthora nicotianae]|uniref:Wbp11/ELF5/Saf1 N-terminal domain-containing protein n=1 Tax=Phytophthora nicotianae TaxID=4792 RepID=A0A0W8DDN2_PHYNI|nr:hypothetical protein AM588_10004442 [Phytophthora nicotianae]
MAKSLNPMEAYRREQKKKELKKHRLERQKDKQAKLTQESRAPSGCKPTDGPTRKRKQELEDTLRAVVKKQKEMVDEERKKQANAPPPPPKTGNTAAVNVEDGHVIAPYPTTDESEDNSVVAPYPPPDEPTEDEEMDEEAAERAAEGQAQLRSLVPVALRVQRQIPAAPSSSVASAPPIPAPRRPVPAPPAPAPRPSVRATPPPPRPMLPKPTDSNSVSNEFDTFMEEVKGLL